jgi:hypothetical protein
MAFNQRKILIEVDFLNEYILEEGYMFDYHADGVNSKPKKRKFDLALKDKFLEKVDSFWHTDKDQLVLFQYFNDGTYFCQRKKKKHDFNTESTYWNEYQFMGASAEQAKTFYASLDCLRSVQREIKNLRVERKVQEIDKEVLFYEQRYFKLRRMRESILNCSDFRVLPDIEESFEGERDMWIKWRKYIREKTLMKPTDPLFDDENGDPSGLKYFRYTYNFRFPVDPKIYYRIYPDGKLTDGVTDAPAFMDENDADQWVRQEVEASHDFFRINETNMFNLAGRGVPVRRKLKDNVLSLMKDLSVDDIIPVDWDKYFTNEDELTE